ncbi:hypothetical protein Mucpa_5194 [Mucilaginibacter paludis DSM 18603]|uniref:KTSC domain-containing protein n=2 Tax=Mucilaginibacter TaxID=423349 RepID=H1Y3B4_9SPHI|nr:hypothetical protein Mucpa_5194 [Mucilaginibacter paludis DSM 18603]
MQRYKSTVNSGVLAYEIGEDRIKVKFLDGTVYLYTYQSAGEENIEQMKALAEKGRGLTTFINQSVSDQYAIKVS